MPKIAVSLTKGGVGKTTTAVNLTAGLAMAGCTVLLVDTDTQGQAAKALGIEPETGLAQVVSGDCGPESAIVEARERLWLLGGGRALAGVKRVIDRKEFAGERVLAEALSPIDGRYDFVIIDTPPGWDPLSINVLFYADEVLAPVSLEVLTIRGLIDFAQSVEAIRQYRTALQLKYVLPTFYDRRVKKSEELLGQLQRHYTERLCPPIRYNVRLSEAPGFGQTIFEYAPRSPGAEDYQALTERVMHNARPQADARHP